MSSITLPEGVKDQINTLLSDANEMKTCIDGTFSQYDIDKNSLLSKEEINTLFGGIQKDLGLPEISQDKIDKLFEDKDENKDKNIDYNEFTNLFTALCQHLSKGEL